jgi:hypothetical protein
MSRQTNTTTCLTDIAMENLGSSPSTWDGAIADFKGRIKELRQAIRVFQEQKRRGEPWPGTQSAGHSEDQQHSV